MTERRVKEAVYIGLAPPRLNFEQRHWFRTITHHHESCQGPTVTEVNKHLDNYSYIIFRLYYYSTIIYRLFLAFFGIFYFVFCFLFSPEDGSSMAVETCWLFKKFV